MKALCKIVTLMVLIFYGSLLKAQTNKERIQAMKVEYITKKVEFTVSENERFWPVYNEFEDKLEAYRKNVRQNYLRRAEAATEAEAEDLYKLDLQSKQAEADLYKQYSERMKAIIGVKKMAKLRLAEIEFKKILLKTAKGE